MKSRIHVAGHRATKTPLGQRSGARCAPPGGWQISCKCGWVEGPFSVRRDAEKSYTEHLRAAAPICSQCGEMKASHEMSKGSPHLCKQCAVANQMAWKAANPDRFKKAQRRSHLKKMFNLTEAEYDAIFSEQGYRCTICGKQPTDPRGFKPHVDHDHQTGAIRGILCNRCNMGLGCFGDDIETLARAIEYLQQSPIEIELWEVAA